MPERIGRNLALILSGGGARAACQVGVLEAIAEIAPAGTPNPFPPKQNQPSKAAVPGYPGMGQIAEPHVEHLPATMQYLKRVIGAHKDGEKDF